MSGGFAGALVGASCCPVVITSTSGGTTEEESDCIRPRQGPDWSAPHGLIHELEDRAEGSLVAAALLPRDSLPSRLLSVGQRLEWGSYLPGTVGEAGDTLPFKTRFGLKCHLVPLTASSTLLR